jgi:hypothetical protein
VFKTWIQKLSATVAVATVLAVVGLAAGLFSPAQAATPNARAAAAVASPSPSGSTTTVTASSVPETQSDVSSVLADNGASSAWPAVNADLTPQLNNAVAAGGGNVLSNVLALPFKIVINCTITFPPLQIKCTIQIQFQPGVTASPSPAPSGSTTTVTASSVPETQSDVSSVLADNGASSAWPAVNADLTPQLNNAVAAGGGNVLSNVLALPFKIVINCTITFPPLKIVCTVQIQIQP